MPQPSNFLFETEPKAQEPQNPAKVPAADNPPKEQAQNASSNTPPPRVAVDGPAPAPAY